LVWRGTAAAVLLWICSTAQPVAGAELPEHSTEIKRLPRIRPDYSQLVIPPNIAPLNFRIEEPGSEFRVRLHGAAGKEILLGSRRASVVIPPEPWRALLEQNPGTNIAVEIYVKGTNGQWARFEPIENTVAREKIDSHLVYRLLGPVCTWFRNMGIYQRNLENFDEKPVLLNSAIGNGCVNCHSFQNNSPDLFSFHVRPDTKDKNARIAAGMVLVQNGSATWLQARSAAAPRPPGYLSWNPAMPVVAFSMSKPGQLFRTAGAEVRDVFDSFSDLAVMNVETCAASTTPGIAAPDRLETFPGWSADGKVLYFSSAQMLWDPNGPPTPELIAKTRYDLMRVAYNVADGSWGKPETVLTAAETGKSILEPRASPDGRYLLFCMTDYGGFPIHQAGCDLYLMDIKSGHYRRLECNSDAADSWHCWSSNSRWFVFSSKRDNGLLARPYFCYLDASGREHKPFVLPQKDPAFYDTWLKTYNVPELVTGPVTATQEELARAVLSGNAAGSRPADQLARPR
jgi:hypothetical protein